VEDASVISERTEIERESGGHERAAVRPLFSHFSWYSSVESAFLGGQAMGESKRPPTKEEIHKLVDMRLVEVIGDMGSTLGMFLPRIVKAAQTGPDDLKTVIRDLEGFANNADEAHAALRMVASALAAGLAVGIAK